MLEMELFYVAFQNWKVRKEAWCTR